MDELSAFKLYVLKKLTKIVKVQMYLAKQIKDTQSVRETYDMLEELTYFVYCTEEEILEEKTFPITEKGEKS